MLYTEEDAYTDVTCFAIASGGGDVWWFGVDASNNPNTVSGYSAYQTASADGGGDDGYDWEPDGDIADTGLYNPDGNYSEASVDLYPTGSAFSSNTNDACVYVIIDGYSSDDVCYTIHTPWSLSGIPNITSACSSPCVGYQNSIAYTLSEKLGGPIPGVPVYEYFGNAYILQGVPMATPNPNCPGPDCVTASDGTFHDVLRIRDITGSGLPGVEPGYAGNGCPTSLSDTSADVTYFYFTQSWWVGSGDYTNPQLGVWVWQATSSPGVHLSGTAFFQTEACPIPATVSTGGG